jgi:hypothetical protein
MLSKKSVTSCQRVWDEKRIQTEFLIAESFGVFLIEKDMKPTF